jgi:hypothetical protein
MQKHRPAKINFWIDIVIRFRGDSLKLQLFANDDSTEKTMSFTEALQILEFGIQLIVYSQSVSGG